MKYSSSPIKQPVDSFYTSYKRRVRNINVDFADETESVHIEVRRSDNNSTDNNFYSSAAAPYILSGESTKRISRSNQKLEETKLTNVEPETSSSIKEGIEQAELFEFVEDYLSANNQVFSIRSNKLFRLKNLVSSSAKGSLDHSVVTIDKLRPIFISKARNGINDSKLLLAKAYTNRQKIMNFIMVGAIIILSFAVFAAY